MLITGEWNNYEIERNTTQWQRQWAINTQSNKDESQNKYPEWEKPDKQSTDCMIPFIENSRKYKLICGDRKQIGGCQGCVMGGQCVYVVGDEQTFGCDGDVHYLEGGDGFLCADISTLRKL